MKNFFIALSLLFVAASVRADDCTGVIVKSSGVVISKEVYCGDLTVVSALQSDRKAKDGTLSFINSTPPDATFTTTPVPLSGVAAALSTDATALNAAVKTPVETAIIDVLKKNGLMP